jgi:hypothetical protein
MTCSGGSTRFSPLSSYQRRPTETVAARLGITAEHVLPAFEKVRNAIEWAEMSSQEAQEYGGFSNDELNRVTRPGQHFGFPYCHQGDLPDREFGSSRQGRT